MLAGFLQGGDGQGKRVKSCGKWKEEDWSTKEGYRGDLMRLNTPFPPQLCWGPT
jgi:hypothetical protein